MKIPLPNGEIAFVRNPLWIGGWALYVILRYGEPNGKPALGCVIKGGQPKHLLGFSAGRFKRYRSFMGLHIRSYRPRAKAPPLTSGASNDQQ